MKKLGLLIPILSLLLLSGCAINKATGSRDPNFEASKINYLYVAHQPKDKRNINLLIQTELEKRGYKVDTGSKVKAPKSIDGLVTYIDKWMWDITNYMIELSVFIRNPENNFPIAQGYSMHTSLTRKSPEEMVKEVVANMLGEGETKEKANVASNK